MKERQFLKSLLKVLIFGVFLIFIIFNIFLLKSTLAANKEKIQIANFESSESWQLPGKLDGKKRMSGQSSLLLSSSGFNWLANSTLTKDIDLSGFEKSNYSMVINVYLEDSASISGIRLDLGKDGGNFYFARQQSVGYYQDGWNQVVFNQGDFDIQGEPGGWNSIKWLRVNLAAKDDSSKVIAYIDDWYLTQSEISVQPKSQNTKITSQSELQKNVEGITDINNEKNNNQGGKMNYIWYVLGFILIVLVAGGILLFKKRKKAPPPGKTFQEEEKPKENPFKKNVNLTVILISIGISLGVIAVISYFTLGANTIKTEKPVVLGTNIVPTAVPTTLKNWEYKVVIFNIPTDTEKTIESSLNDLGKKGWELVSQTSVSTGKTGSYYQYNTFKKIKN